MATMVRVSRAEILAALSSTLRHLPGVAAVYLFGSALGEMRPDSDIDIGVVPLAGADPFQIVGDLEGLSPLVGGHPVHATVLDGRDTLFAFQVLSGGELIHCANDETLTDFIERVSLRYADVGPPYEWALRQIYGSVGGEVPGGQPDDRS